MPLGFDISGYMPDFAGIGQSVLTGLFFFIVIIALGVMGWLWLENKKYKYRIDVFENLGGTRYVKTLTDRAKVISVGAGGEELLWLRKKKAYRTAYARKMGKNLIWFAIGQDGYWYNVTLGDLDAKQGELDIEPIDRDMRYMHVAIRKNIENRYKKVKFMEKYGTIIMNSLFLIIMLFGLYFLITKLGDASSAAGAAAEASRQTMEMAKQVLGALENICAGSGLR
jgi:hypothetical protein